MKNEISRYQFQFFPQFHFPLYFDIIQKLYNDLSVVNTIKIIFIESDINSFEDFHDKKWFESLFAMTEGTEIQREVEEFAAHWWGASRAFILPWLLVTGVYDGIHSVVPIMDKTNQDFWGEYLKTNEFKGSLWKVAEGAYNSIYFAYENFIVSLLNKKQEKSIRITDRQFNSLLIDEFGVNLANLVWNDSFVAVSREVRNCLAHNGGKASPRLKKMRPLPMIEKENILISATDVRLLYQKLKPKVYSIVQYYLKES